MNTKAVAAVLFLSAFGAAGTAAAANAVVGPPNCNEAGFASALSVVDGSGGGTITFNCGTATIAFTSHKSIANAVVIDGGGAITFDGGNASPLFQVFFSANVTLARLTLTHGAYAGGVHAIENFGSLKLDHVRVVDNVSTRGAVLSSGSLRVRASTFSGNIATSTTDGNGGAVENSSGDMDVRDSTFNGNVAAHHGGAIYSNSDLDVYNSTFTANSTTGSGTGGGAIYRTGSGSSLIQHATIVGNSGQAFGGGIYSDGGGTMLVSRSIIANNTNSNCDGLMNSGGYNVWFGATACGFSQPGDGAGDPLLGALANNGGATQTMLPASGSAAVNRIPNAQCALPYDQRGAVRPEGPALPSSGMCDSGAVERGSTIDQIFYDNFE